MKCDQCTEPAMAIAPGTEPIRELFALTHGQPLRCWCWCHWRAVYLQQEETDGRDHEGTGQASEGANTAAE